MILGVEGADERDVVQVWEIGGVRQNRNNPVQAVCVCRHRQVMNRPDTCIMKFHVKFFVENKDYITWINCGVGIKHNIRTVVDPGDIAYTFFSAYV